MTTSNGPVQKARRGPAAKRRFLIRLTAVLCGGMFIDGYILGIIGTVIGQIGTDLEISPLYEGLIAASALLGIFIGSPLGGWAADKFGRKPMFMVDMGLFVSPSFLPASGRTQALARETSPTGSTPMINALCTQLR